MESAVIVFKNDIGNKPKLETNKFFFSIQQIEREMAIWFESTQMNI